MTEPYGEEVRARWLPWMTCVWVLVGIVIAFCERFLWDAIWVGIVGVWGIYAVVGLGLLSAAGIGAWRTRRPTSVALPVSILLMGAALWLARPHLVRTGDQFQFDRRFARLRPQYERIIKEVVPAPDSAEWKGRTSGGVHYYVDQGPPLRIAFVQPGGIFDNWEGVVYDPSGAVRSATGWRNGMPGDYSAHHEVVRLFGGDLVYCEPIQDSFYRCQFT